MVHPWPREVALSYCTHCGIVRTAKHVSREDKIPARFCTRCGSKLAVSIYRQHRELATLG